MLAQQIAISPAVLEATVQSFNLASKEKAEFEAVSITLSLDRPTSAQERELEDLALKTKNVSIQYLLLNQPNLARLVAYNEHLKPRVILLFLERIKSAERGSLHPDEIHAVKSLLSNKSVVSNVSLFKRTWGVAILLDLLPISSSKAANRFNHLYDALNFHSISTEVDSNAMNIETLLLILAYLHSQEEKYGPDEEIEAARDIVLSAREGEIKAWIQSNMPDYVGLPLAWVLKVYDLH